MRDHWRCTTKSKVVTWPHTEKVRNPHNENAKERLPQFDVLNSLKTPKNGDATEMRASIQLHGTTCDLRFWP